MLCDVKFQSKMFKIGQKGATIWQNMFFDREFTFSNNNKIYSGILFFRKKDAEAYLETLEYKESLS